MATLVKYLIYVGFRLACPDMSKVFQNNKATVSLGRVELFCLFVACSYTYVEATLLSCCFSWAWSSMPEVL